MKKAIEAITKGEVSFWVGIIVLIVGIAVPFAVAQARISTLEERFDYFGGRYSDHIEKSDHRFEEVSSAFTQIQVQLAEIKTDLSYLKSRSN